MLALGNKIDTGYYEILKDGQKVGEIVKEKAPAIGSKNYVGYVPSYTRWVLYLDDRDNVIMLDIEKLSEVKERLQEVI